MQIKSVCFDFLRDRVDGWYVGENGEFLGKRRQMLSDDHRLRQLMNSLENFLRTTAGGAIHPALLTSHYLFLMINASGWAWKLAGFSLSDAELHKKRGFLEHNIAPGDTFHSGDHGLITRQFKSVDKSLTPQLTEICEALAAMQKPAPVAAPKPEKVPEAPLEKEGAVVAPEEVVKPPEPPLTPGPARVGSPTSLLDQLKKRTKSKQASKKKR